MNWLVGQLVSAGWGPVSYLEMVWLLLTAWAVYYLVDCLRDARAQVRAAADRVERWIAQGDERTEHKELLHQAGYALIGLWSALTPAAEVRADMDAQRAAGALVFTGVLVVVQATNVAAAYQRRRTRLRVTAELRRQQRAPVPPGAVPVPGGRRAYDPAVPTQASIGEEET